jgi:pilus assembly protein TadC
MSALSDFFTLPVILGFLTCFIFLVGLGALINIARKKEGTGDKYGRTIPM